MTDVAQIVARLTKGQREAIYPGPGNPEYARGSVGTMKKLEALGVVERVNAFSVNGKRGARLTRPLGLAVRSHLLGEKPRD